MDILHLLSPPELDALRAIADHRPVASTSAAKQLIPMGLVEELLPNRFELTGQGLALLDDMPVRDRPAFDKRAVDKPASGTPADKHAHDMPDTRRTASHCSVQ